MRDWSKTLRRASYRGVPFWVDYDDLSGGKRLAVHEFAGGRDSLIEEMGLRTRSFEVTAYLLGDVADIAAQALIVSCEAPGSGLLVLPMDIPSMAYVEDYRRSRQKDKNGYVAFDIRFVPERLRIGAALTPGDLAAAFSAGLVAAAASFGGLF